LFTLVVQQYHVRKSILTLGFILFAKIAMGQSISTQMGARGTGMGYASSAGKDEWSLFNNPGGLGKISQINAAFAYEMQSQLKSANRMGAVFNRPFSWGTPSVGLFRFGDELYNEQALSLGFGNQFGIASLGVKANLIQYQAEGFGVSTALSVDFGGITELTETLSIGAYIINLTQSHISEDEDRLPTRLTAGLSYKPEKNISLTTELSKELEYGTIWRTGIEYSFHEKVFFRTGFNLNPNAGFFGLGVNKKKVKFDYAMQFNHLTGASHQASASYWFPKKDKK
jgi:hypothetical protein